ncbi:MAG: phosphoglycolate phosphatase [Gammaproteobacteria bacterium]|nr:phosphoglycolate phosphatase [Gammaproteobacteria bacterium]
MKAFPGPSAAPDREVSRAWPRAVLFDLDGTLVDTGPDIAAAVNGMLFAMGRHPYTVEQVLDWVGDGAPRLVERALAGNLDGRPPSAEAERGLALFYEHYAANICVHSEPYPHARQVLESLRAAGVLIGCVTNKPEQLSRSLLDVLGLASMFDVIVGGDTLAFRKPRPEPIHHACRALGLCPEDTAYVGDSITDCLAADAAGVPMVAVTYGYNRDADLTKSTCAAMIDSLGALPEALMNTGKKPTKR